ncbi:MAG: SEL1-like repeat protein [Gammaproteobacteria bacterium]|jgi:TPR repeat protein
MNNIFKIIILNIICLSLCSCTSDFNPSSNLISIWKKINLKFHQKQSSKNTASFAYTNPLAEAENNYQNSTNPETQTTSLKMIERLAKLGDPNAGFKLGEIHLQGIGVTKNPNIAISWFQKAATSGLPVAMLQLGNIYRDGITAPPSLKTAVSWYEKAAAAGNIKAMLNLGEIYRGWYGMTPNYNKAMEMYVKAAGMGSLEAEYQMARLITNNLVDNNKYAVKISSLIKSLQYSANNGNLDAMVGLGDHYMNKPNTELALSYYTKASEQNFAPALLRLGLLYFHGEGVEKNYQTAIQLFTRAAELGNVVSQYHLGEIYRQGLGVDKDAATASIWYTKAADKNFTKSLARLADLYFSGTGVEANIHTAIELYNKAAVLGDSYSSLMLSIFYANGLGVEQDLPRSVHWYNTSETKKDLLVAKFNIAKAYETGFGFTKNYNEAARWYLLAAKQGMAKAQTKLADLYMNGLGIPKDYKLALQWYKEAAELGYNYAQYSIALLLPKMEHYKPPIAYAWMKKAALGGYKPAQYSVALMYLQGTGTKINPIKAYSWLSVALDNGYESIPELTTTLTKNFEPETLNKAVLLAQRYREKYGVEQQNEN